MCVRVSESELCVCVSECLCDGVNVCITHHTPHSRQCHRRSQREKQRTAGQCSNS